MGAPAANTPPSPPAESTSVDSGKGHGPGLLIASIASFTLGAASAGVGTYYLIQASDTRNESEKIYQQCVAETGGEQKNCKDPVRMDQTLSLDADADHQTKLGIVGVVGGGVGLIAGLTFLIVDVNRSDKSARQSTPHVTPVFGFRSIGVVGTF